MKIIKVTNKIRLRVRRIYEENFLEETINRAKEKGCEVVRSTHGGSVANAYAYPADTEGMIAVGFPDGSGWAEVVRLPANKVSHAGVFKHVWGEHGLFDRRFSEKRKKEVRAEFVNFVKNELKNTYPL